MHRVLVARAIFFALVPLLAWLLAPRAALAYTPPPIAGHVNDLAGVRAADERGRIETRLTDVDRTSGAEIAVLILPTLDGETIESVAYTTFNTWKLGKKGIDNGALLVIATGEHRIRIEVGKGVTGSLTDARASDIIRTRIGPLLKQARFYDAVTAGTDAIADAITKGGAASPPPRPAGLGIAGVMGLLVLLGMFGMPFLLIALVVVLIVRSRGGRAGQAAGGYGTASGAPYDPTLDRRGTSTDSSFGSGSDAIGGGGFSGGGGSSDGGGASGSY